MKFLEMKTSIGNDILININTIKSIVIIPSRNKIRIFTSDDIFEECFGEDENKLMMRYNQIKEIVNGK